MNATLSMLPRFGPMALRGGAVLVGIVLSSVASAVTIGARFGPGPRDGLMTGLSERFKCSIRFARASIEITVLIAGAVLGGTIGVATLLYALAIGPLVHLFMPVFATSPRAPA